MKLMLSTYTVKMVIDILVPSRDVMHRPRKFGEFDQESWSVTSRLGTGKSISFFYSVPVKLPSSPVGLNLNVSASIEN